MDATENNFWFLVCVLELAPSRPLMAEQSRSLMIIIMLVVFVTWLTRERRLALFPARVIVRDPRHRESSTCCVQDLNLCRT